MELFIRDRNIEVTGSTIQNVSHNKQAVLNAIVAHHRWFSSNENEDILKNVHFQLQELAHWIRGATGLAMNISCL